MGTPTHLQADADLTDYATIHVEDSEYPRRTDLIEHSLDGDVDVRTAREGSYQGTMVAVFSHAGYVWVLTDAFGSCSHCDGLLRASKTVRRGDDEQAIHNYTETMLNGAMAFHSCDDAITYIEGAVADDENLSWGMTFADVSDEAIELLAELQADILSGGGVLQ